jgi:hypothetical protein
MIAHPPISRVTWPIGFVVLLGCFLAPVWLLDYFPTQDGAAHLSTAWLIRDTLRADSPYAEFFEVRSDPVPNWFVQAVLIVLFEVVPPLVAEKMLLTFYVILFLLGFRAFLGAVRPGSEWIALLALPLAFNRCLWMGFYNYCFAMAFFWWILALFLHMRERSGWRLTALLAVLLTLTYFSHLMIFLLSLLALALLACAGPAPALALLRLWIAALPALGLAAAYFDSEGFVGSRVLGGFLNDAGVRLRNGRFLEVLEEPLLVFDRQTFGPVLDHVPWASLPLVALTLLLFGAALFLPRRDPMPGRRFAVVAALALLLAVSYVVMPEHLGLQHGGFLKQRMPPLLWLLVLVLVGEPDRGVSRGAAAGLIVGVALFYAGLNFRYAAPESAAIADIAAAGPAIGDGRIYFTHFRDMHNRLSNPQLHAGDLFSVGTRNVNLHNYQALTNHFPIRYRDTRIHSLDGLAGFPYRQRIDTYVFHGYRPESFARTLGGFEQVYHQGELSVWQRPAR